MDTPDPPTRPVALCALVATSCGTDSAAPLGPSPSPSAGPTSAPGAQQAAAIAGSVLDTGYRVVSDAGIESIDGSGQISVSVQSGADGRFALTGTFDSATTLRASKGVRPKSTTAQRWRHSKALSVAQRVLHLDEKLIRIELPAIENRSDVVVVDHEEIGDRPERPSKTRIGTD